MQAPTTSPSKTPLHRRIHVAGTVVLVVGVISAIVIYGVAAASSHASNAPDFSGDRRFNYELERLGGKFAVYSAAFNRWLGTLWVGTNLAYTVAVLSLLTALACYWLADFLSYPPLDDAALPPKGSGGSGR